MGADGRTDMEKEPLDSLEQWGNQYLVYLQKNL